MSEQTKTQMIKANRAPEQEISESLSKDHYLLLLERKKFDRAGNKTSKPEIRHVPINDWLSYAEDRFFEKHGYDVEILHDPTLGEGEAPMTASVGGGSAATAQTTASVKVTKKQLIEKLAKLVEVDPTTIDQKLTVKELEQQIAEYEKK